MSNSLQILNDKIEEYKSKYYKNQLIKGLLISLGLLFSVFLFVNFIEYFGRLGSVFRAILLLLFIAVAVYTLVYLIGKPLLHFIKVRQGVSDQEAAVNIGRFFPEIGDKLLNTLQLSATADAENQLLLASIEQKSKNLTFYKFSDAINLGDNKKYLKYVLPPLVLILFISAISPKFFQSSERIFKFREEFIEEAPFDFVLQNEDLNAYRNEDFTLKLSLEGNSIPEEVYLIYNERRFRMDQDDEGVYQYTFNKLQDNVEFNFLASGFESKRHELSLLSRPELLSFDVEAIYPKYLNQSPEKLQNVGNLIIPEGTRLKWLFKTQYADSLSLLFGDEIAIAKQNNQNEYSFSKNLIQSSDYQVLIKNNQTQGDEKIAYYINVIKDQYPKIDLEQIKDTTLYNFIALGGTIADDYGFTDLKLKYRLKGQEKYNETPIALNKSQLSQTFYYQFDVASLQLNQGEQLEYFLEVRDNDGVHGPKSSRSSLQTFGMPSSEKFDEEVEKQVEDTEQKMENLLQKSKELKRSLEEIDKDLKSKKEIDYQEKKKLEELIKKRQEMLDDLRKLQEQYDRMQEKQNRFQEQSSETQKKMEQLQNLLDELMKEENNELFKQMEEMLENNEEDKLQEQIEKMKNQDRNLDKEIDRTLKLFKQMQLKQKVDNITKDLEELAEKQEKLAEKTEKNTDEKNNQQLEKEQEKINEEFKKQQEKIDEAEKLSKELRKPFDDQNEKQEEVSEEQQKASEQLEQKNSKESSKSQKKAAKSMKSMASAMQAQMQSAEMKQLDLDIEALRAILENLVKLSFDQEELMKGFRGLSKSDPRFVEYSQDQLKLVDDAKVIEDSLYSLAQRVMQLESFVTKEVTSMKNTMDESITLLRERELPKATAKQQFSMTSMNNLALMLSDTFQQMQEMMAAMSMPGSGEGKQEGAAPSPGLGKQQGDLNKRMQGLGKNGQSQSEMSKELAKIANEQAKIRKKIQEMQDQLNGTELGKKFGNDLQEMQKQMDDTENDLINKRINPELFKRQQKLETRLLEVEKAVKEQELDTKRKSKSAIEINRTSPPSLEEFMKEKQKQLELIRTTPPNFTPFYKQETDNYFKRLN
ncbi:DUF4175 family protein [Jiulongibacter sp. NS-SX5]|uniref:DUF4175 family protein n=1 Tax=Jiulongibacter sp. NS-SX5 TaxID=3463854 RepID=UPI0040581DB2